MRRELHFGDNLKVLRDKDLFPDESIDLIYLDPPFNSNASYNMLFKDKTGTQSEAQITAFDDTWTWGPSAAEALDDIMTREDVPLKLQQLMPALKDFLGYNDMLAYLTMMAVRLVELHRVLKETGSLYLHCDPTASHYLKLVLDAVFGIQNYQNEIIWRRTGSHNSAKRFGPIHDVIHFYKKSDAYRHNSVFRPYSHGHVESYFKKDDAKGKYWTNSVHGAGTRNGESGQIWRGYDPTARGRHWAIPSQLVLELGIDPDLKPLEKLERLYKKGVIDLPENMDSLPTYRQYLSNSPGLLAQDLWTYQPHTKGMLYNSDEGVDEDVRWLTAQASEERLGYPTQKPLGLLERIIQASSNPGDVVLDPFCGCGTAVDAAETLKRQWVGIDVTHLSINLIERRMREAHPHLTAKNAYKVLGTPTTMNGAQRLFRENTMQFEKWAVSLIPGAREYKLGGGDGGIDGIFRFADENRDYKTGLLSVKGGKTLNPSMVRDLRGVVERESLCEMGIFICLSEPTQGMRTEAASAGFYEVAGKRIPRLQIATVENLLDEKLPIMPGLIDESAVFKKAKKAKVDKQGKLL